LASTKASFFETTTVTAMTRFSLCLALQLLLVEILVREASCFVVPATGTTTRRSWTEKLPSTMPAAYPEQGQQQEETRPVQPVFVMDKTAAIAAILALHTMRVLTEDCRVPVDKSGQPPQLPVFLVESPDLLQEAMTESPRAPNEIDSILHLGMDISAGRGGMMMLTPGALQQVSFLGMHLYCGDGAEVSLDIAQTAGNSLAQVLGYLSASSQNHDLNDNRRAEYFSVVSLDLDLHLAMLRTNALPKQPSHPAHGDCYHVATPEGGSVLMEYYFDYANSMGGSDPLLCPTKETLVETPPTAPSLRRSQELNAAYTVLCGQGMNVLSSAAIAASCATILGDDGGYAHSVTWDMIQRSATLASFIRQFGSSEQDPGFMRKKYKEAGYQ
jgi:hypothetical protein